MCVLDESSLSDHNNVLFFLAEITTNAAQYRNRRTSDWTFFMDSLAARLRRPERISFYFNLYGVLLQLKDVMLDFYHESRPNQ